MKQGSLFYKIYFSVIGVFVISLIAGLFVFNNWLKDYEAGQPEQIIEKIVTEKVKTGKLFSARKELSLKISDCESDEGFSAVLKPLTDGKTITYSTAVKKPDDCDSAYTVKADETPFLNVYLKKEGKKYAVSYSEFVPSMYKTVSIICTSDAQILVNGVAVKDVTRKNQPLPNIKSELLTSKDIIHKQIIKLDNFLSLPKTVTATSGGKELKITAEETNYSVTQEFEEMEKIADVASKAGKACAAYMQNDGSLTEIRKYCDTETEFYKNIRTTIVSFVLSHDGYTIKNLKVSEHHKYSDSLFCCRVSFTNQLKKGASVYNDYFDKYVYLQKTDKGFTVIDMQNVS